MESRCEHCDCLFSLAKRFMASTFTKVAESVIPIIPTQITMLLPNFQGTILTLFSIFYTLTEYVHTADKTSFLHRDGFQVVQSSLLAISQLDMWFTPRNWESKSTMFHPGRCIPNCISHTKSGTSPVFILAEVKSYSETSLISISRPICALALFAHLRSSGMVGHRSEIVTPEVRSMVAGLCLEHSHDTAFENIFPRPPLHFSY